MGLLSRRASQPAMKRSAFFPAATPLLAGVLHPTIQLNIMATAPVEHIIEQIRALAPEQQVQVAEAVDRLTWARRWRNICERIELRARNMPVPTDDEIDETVRAVRREKPLSERSSTPRS